MKLIDQIDYVAGQRNAKPLVNTTNGVIVLMACDKGVEIPTHTAHATVLVQILEGVCDFTLQGQVHRMAAGDALIMQPGAEHSLSAPERFKVMVTKINA